MHKWRVLAVLTRSAAACQVKREHLCAATGGYENPFRVPMIALAEAGFARRSQSAGGFGNPFRVPMS